MTIETTELRSGYRIARLIKGGWQLAGGHGPVDKGAAIADMAAYVEAGITTFDCADIYTGVEDMIGAFRQTLPQDARARVKVHTKFVPDLEILDSISPRSSKKSPGFAPHSTRAPGGITTSTRRS